MIARTAGTGDINQIIGLYRALVGTAPLAGDEAVRAVLDHSGTQIWCVDLGGVLVSMATLHVLPNVTQGGRPYALIENVVCLPEHQSNGYGRAVMQGAMAAAWDANAYKIMLMTGKTAEARGFYEKLGFSADEKWGMSLRRAPLRDTASR